jgi:hypothetical protein
MATKKSLMAHAIKTGHFGEVETGLLKRLWARACKGFGGLHFEFSPDARECAIMRGWEINYCGDFYFSTTHDLCDAWFTKAGLERMARKMYRRELEARIEDVRARKDERERKATEANATDPSLAATYYWLADSDGEWLYRVGQMILWDTWDEAIIAGKL